MTDYKALSPIEAIRSRPGMYIGETYNPNQLATEALDNALDEVANGHATKCQIYFDLENNNCWISDNGRGIRSYQMQDANGEYSNSIYLLCTATHSGSKFDNNDYNTLIGMHGVGLVVLNALSNWLVVKTRDRENRKLVYEYNFLDGELHSNNSYEDLEDVNGWSTIIGFEPNSNYFETEKIEIKEFANRLMLAQAKFPKCDFLFNGKEVTKRDFVDYVRKVLNLDDETSIKKISYNKSESQKIELYYNFEQGDNTNILGDVNLRHCDGTYLTNIQTILKNIIFEKLGKKFENINPNLLLMGLNLYASVTVPEPKFDSQSKTRMTLDVKNDLIFPIQDKIKRSLDSGTVEIIKNNLENRLNKKFVQTVTSKSAAKISAKNKLKDCAQSPGKILYIVEGDSALGPLKQIRDVKTEAIFPLRGKMINVETASIDKIKDNKEISDLLEALGSKNKRRYEKIKVLGDADSVSAESMIHYVDENGFIQRNQIQNMYENFEEGYIESLNKETGDCELKKINRVIAHNYDKDEIFRITTIGKHCEDFTDDHVVYVWDNKKYQVKETLPSKIDTTTELMIIPKKRFTPNKKIEIDITNSIIDILSKNSKSYIEINSSDFLWDTEHARMDISNKVDMSHVTHRKLSQEIDVPLPTLRMYLYGVDNTFAPVKTVNKIMNIVIINLFKSTTKIVLDYDTKHYLNVGKLKSYNQGEIRHKLTINPDLAYLIGQYIGDGCYGSSKNNPYSINFSTGDGRHLEKIEKCLNNLGYTNYTKYVNNEYNNTDLYVKSIELYAILNHLGLKRECVNRYKFIPNILFSAEYETRIALLKGLYHSDGTLFETDHKRQRFSYSTNSEQLREDVCYLLKQFGINPLKVVSKAAIAKKNKKGIQIKSSKDSYHINVNKYSYLEKISEIFEDNELNEYEYNEYDKNLIDISDDFEAIRIKSIEKVPYHYDKVYDLEVEDNNNFPVGTNGAIVHNSDGHHITVLALLALLKFADDTIQNGQVSIILPPLYGASKGKQFFPIYNHDELENYKGYEITRFKGLGEMSPKKLKASIDANVEYVVEYPESRKQLDSLLNIIKNTEMKRLLLKKTEFNFEKLLEKAKT